jgi:RNA polymerase sigma factor (sigma-70 family)
VQRFWQPSIALPRKDRAVMLAEVRFQDLLSREGGALMRLAASYAATSQDRDDLFQDIALAIWQALPRFRGECSERTFIFRIAHNRAISHLAQRRPLAADAEEVDIPDPRPNPEKILSQEQRERRLAGAIHRLPLNYRQVIALTLEGMSYTDISDILGIGESNVGARLTRARQLLRRLLENPHEE